MERFTPKPIQNAEPLENAGIDAIDQFRAASIKVAIQKGGALTEISRGIVRDRLGITIPTPGKGEKVMAGVTDDPDVGYLYAKNQDLPKLVKNGIVDIAVVGADQLLEQYVEREVEIVDIFREHTWPIVLATRPDSDIEDLSEVRTIATSYPRITREAFNQVDNPEVQIIETAGGTELYAYMELGGKQIDAISDITQTGNSLRAHGLTRWDPPLYHVSPVLITPTDSTVMELFRDQGQTKERDIEDTTVVFDAGTYMNFDRR